MTIAQIEAALREAPPEHRFVLAARLIGEYQAEQEAIERSERFRRKLNRR